MTTRLQKRDRTRQRILNAAISVFAEMGFDASSMGLIARRSGVKKALVQYHFETKDNLWRASVGELFDQMTTNFPAYVGSVDRSENENYMRGVFLQFIRFARDHPAWVAILFRESATPGPRLEWLVDHHLGKQIADGSAFIELAQAQGLLPPGPPLHLLHIISGALLYPLLIAPMTQYATGTNLADDDNLEILLDTFIQLLHRPAA